jgi:hypothetical protein
MQRILRESPITFDIEYIENNVGSCKLTVLYEQIYTTPTAPPLL